VEFVLGIDGDQYEVRITGGHGAVTVGEAIGRIEGAGSVVIDGTAVPLTRPLGSAVQPGSLVDVSTGILEAADSDGADGGGRRRFNRPPRSEFPVAPAPLPAPMARDAPRSTFRFGWAALVVPVLLGVVLAVAIHPRMALFAVISPAMALANWIEDRRRTHAGLRRSADALRHELAAFQDRLMAAIRAEERLRRRAHPDLGELAGRVARRDGRLWERRRHHADLLELAVGSACLPWTPTLATGPDGPAPEVTQMIEDFGVLHDVPVTVAPKSGSVIGIAGGDPVRRAVARSLLVQAVVLHGPADLRVWIVADDTRRWDWAKWLPHAMIDTSTGRRRLATAAAESALVLGDFGRGAGAADRRNAPMTDQPADLLIADVDDPADPGRDAVREAIDRAAAGAGSVIALAASVAQLPSRCAVVIDVAPDGAATLRIPDRGIRIDAIAPWHLSADAARRTARRMAAIADPEVASAGADLPAQVRLVDLIDLPERSANDITQRWARSRAADPSVPVGVGAGGHLELSLVRDGPHALLAGTTGSGKSEFLRSLVASMAATSSPEDLTFVLVDYKGGSAFDICARLPHTVGLVTDLDGHLARRALSCLEAELQYREEQLRTVGAADLAAYRSSRPSHPLPRLFVVVDEFAALANELPDFMTSLIDIAQRGRSLGVHLLLATQRPQGVINDQIRANTNLRIALRVQDAADSVDVIGGREAAGIGRSQPGRGFVRLGAGDVQPFQAASVTGPSTGLAPPRLVPFVFAHEQPLGPAPVVDADAPSDLDVLVSAIVAANEQLGIAPPRRPWPDPLPDTLLASELGPANSPNRATYGLADEPGRQRQVPATWSLADGNLLLVGVTGSGTTTALASMAIGLARSSEPDALHLYVLDFDDQALAPLAGLPHTGGYVGAAERERQVRLIRMLQGEIDRRRRLAAADLAALTTVPTVVLLIDNYAGFASSFDDPADLAIKSGLGRVIADGPGVGIVSIVAAKQPVDVPAQVSSLIPARLLFRLSDRYEYAGLGAPGVDPPAQPGRCYESWTGREVHVAAAHRDGPAAAVALVEPRSALDRPPAPIGTLPEEVKVSQLVDAAAVFDSEWILPVGIGDAELAPVGFRLGEGDHVVISGPARSGKSTALTTLARVGRAARPDLPVFAVVPRRTPLRECPEVDRVLETVRDLRTLLDGVGSALVLVDDAAVVDDADGILAELAAQPRPGVHVAAAAAAELLRAAYGHWTAGLRRSRLGLALKPNPASDGDLWQTTLPRRGPAQFGPGRGYLVIEGSCELVQVAGT
jgi:S-DNA-T family DNA segregation ATPase FtsK/SpoIIIE